jgi:outer membrane protein assembly factor BamA
MKTKQIAAWVLMGLLCSSAVAAQQSVATEADQTRPATPPPPPESDDEGFIGKTKTWAEDHQLAERLSGDVDGWYPRLGRMTRGGGLALGPGYRFHPMGGPVLVDLSAAMSMKSYKSVDANVRWYQAAGERFEVWTDYRFEDFPQEDYFGPGFNSSPDTRTSYGFGSHDFQVRGLVKPRPWLNVGANVGYMMPTISGGRDKNFPSIEELFTEAQAPGLLEQPDYLHTTVFTEFDYRDVRGNPGSGGFYRLSFGTWDDRSLGQYNFRRLDLNLNQFVPLDSSKKHVVSGRLGVSTTNNDDNSRVPFYFLPYVGGVDTIRSFREFRFKDENAIWLGVEYLYRPIPAVTFALFADGGKVAHDWDGVNLNGLKKGYGAGVRFGSKKQQFGRLDFGFGGGEGMRTFLKFGLGL